MKTRLMREMRSKEIFIGRSLVVISILCVFLSLLIFAPASSAFGASHTCTFNRSSFTYREATCTMPSSLSATCTTCGKRITEFGNPLGHKLSLPGLLGGTCVRCGKYVTLEGGSSGGLFKKDPLDLQCLAGHGLIPIVHITM